MSKHILPYYFVKSEGHCKIMVFFLNFYAINDNIIIELIYKYIASLKEKTKSLRTTAISRFEISKQFHRHLTLTFDLSTIS